jgi:hypothetical protein
MPKHSEQALVYDPTVRTRRGVTLEVTAPQFILDCMESGKFSYELVAQEAFDMPGKGFVIEVKVVVKTREGKRRR